MFKRFAFVILLVCLGFGAVLSGPYEAAGAEFTLTEEDPPPPFCPPNCGVNT